ncbi:hypothetical protein BJX68DRAFT_265037 [Aspergillus pseudodeflectus]|uniref:Apple domain-containing protein n=1 Tax=Aspergillus pseudodeflectus TaxID=176178 RepID=A0ABR4KMT2_9EURO
MLSTIPLLFTLTLLSATGTAAPTPQSAEQGEPIVMGKNSSGRVPDYTRTTSDMYDCLEACDETTECSSGAYNPSTQECRLWDTPDPGWSNSADFDGFFHIGRVN